MDFAFARFLTGLAGASSLFLVASGLSVIVGVTRVVNFAHGLLLTFGATLGFEDLVVPVWGPDDLLGPRARPRRGRDFARLIADRAVVIGRGHVRLTATVTEVAADAGACAARLSV